MSRGERICCLCGTTEEEEKLFKVNEQDSEYHGKWLCLNCYVDELAEEPSDDTQNTEDYEDDVYEPEYETGYGDIDDMDDDDLDDILKEIFND